MRVTACKMTHVHAWIAFTCDVCRWVTAYIITAGARMKVRVCTSKKMIKCTKNAAHVATVHEHACLCNSLFLIEDSWTYIFYVIRQTSSPFTYIRSRIKTRICWSSNDYETCVYINDNSHWRIWKKKNFQLMSLNSKAPSKLSIISFFCLSIPYKLRDFWIFLLVEMFLDWWFTKFQRLKTNGIFLFYQWHQFKIVLISINNMLVK